MSSPSRPPTSSTVRSAEVLLHPLSEFYGRERLPLPPVAEIDPLDMPEPYRSLLVHQNDMTSTLERFHGGRIHIEVHGHRRTGDEYLRRVVLRMDGSGQPVELGSTRLDLALFPERARAMILAEHVPLGRVLLDCGIQFSSRPIAFFRCASDRSINELLGLTGAQVLYGRSNALYDAEGRTLASIVEILPPATSV